MRVAFLGLGQMGTPMAWRLIGAGHDVIVWNRTPGRAEPFASGGAREAATPAEAVADAEVVITMLTDRDSVDEVLFGRTSNLTPIRPTSSSATRPRTCGS